MVLMRPERLTQQTARTTPYHRGAEFANGDDTNLRNRSGRQRFPIGNQATPGQALALLPDVGEVAPVLETH